MASCVSGHSPVAATIAVVLSRKTQETTRTTRSYVRVETPSSVTDPSRPPTIASSAARRSASTPGPTSLASGLVRPTSGGTRMSAITARFAATIADEQDQDRGDRHSASSSRSWGVGNAALASGAS